MAKQKKPAEQVKPVGQDEKQRWSVSLPHCPRMVIEAADPDEAWVKYKAANGIIASDHQPTVNPVEQEDADDADQSGAGPDDQGNDAREDGGDGGQSPADV